MEGLTDQEIAVIEHLANAMIAFSQLNLYHPDDDRDFADGIHVCQRTVMKRLAVRMHPDLFPYGGG